MNHLNKIATDQAFMQQLEQMREQGLDLACDHHCRLRLAWINLREKPWPIALASTCSILRSLPEHSGGGAAYHHTLTVASLRLILSRIRRFDGDDYQDFLRQYPELSNDFKQLISSYYSAERLADDSARRRFLPPDKRSLES